MSNGALSSIGLRAMFASNAQLNTTAHNIANVNNLDYSRQDVTLATASGQYSGAGFFGKGVDVTNVRRAHDQFLTLQNMASQSLSAMDNARAQQLSQLEAVFPPGATGLGYHMGDFFASMTALANAPADASARQVVLSRVSDVASQFAFSGQRLDELQSGVRTDLANSAQTVNTLAQGIADLNQQISNFQGMNQLPNDLLDQRDGLITELGKYIQVSTVAAGDGTVGVFIGGGQRLVLGSEASKLEMMIGTPDTTQAQLKITNGARSITLSADIITGGSIAGLLRYQNEDLVSARNQLGQMAAAFAQQVNRAQSLGLDLRVPPGSGVPLFGFNATVPGMAAAQNARDAQGTPLTSATTTITDGSLLQASDYELRLNTSGVGKTFEMTRLLDGTKLYVDDGDTIDGFRLTMGGSQSLQAGEMLLLKPTSLVASTMYRALDDPDGIAAALPATATMGTANTGTARISDLKLTGNPAYDPNVTVDVTFTSATGNYSVQLRDATSGTVIQTSNGVWQAGQPLIANGVSYTLTGVPDSGDTLSIEKTRFPASNNGNALAMRSLSEAPLVGRRLDGSGAPMGGSTVTDAYAAVMANVGVRSQAAQTASKISSKAAEDARNQLSSAVGVNLDEEAARLIQFQQSYQAAAKILSTAQAIFDTVLSLAR